LVGQTNARERSAAAGIPHTGRKLREAQLFFKKLAEYGKQFVGEPKEEVVDYVPRHIIRLLWPTGLCDRRYIGAGSQSWDPALSAETGHITQPP